MTIKESLHLADTLDIWRKVDDLRHDGCLSLDGMSLDIASVVAVARDNHSAQISPNPEVSNRVHAGVKTLHEYLEKGYFIYGVNTGFGGSADSRTPEVGKLQQALLQLTQTGILTETGNLHGSLNTLPLSWVRASIATRCNHLLRGHSGVRLDIIRAMLELLRNGMTPIIPMRGSISASGDLMPLSYIVGVLEGNPDIKVHWDRQPNPCTISAPEALQAIGVEPFVLGPKEGLGLINGAAPSAAVGALAVYDASRLVVLSQALTAMTCEAMLGNAENYHEFPAAIRPHPGQIEIAANIRGVLDGSKLVETSAAKDHFRQGLFQDRYALRGASQWLGPQVEDLGLAMKQITTELNSTQDNPVIDSESGEIYFCCNFQAASVTSAMEKTRGALQMMGKLLFSYSSELINPDLSKGLPPNLVADEPSLSFTMKGVDINMAAYLSELGWLTHSVTPHVQSAEMHNQPINSLALISARYTMQAVELVSMMSACLLYVACQALDLRVRDILFLEALENEVGSAVVQEMMGYLVVEKAEFQSRFKTAVSRSWKESSREDLQVRVRLMSDAIAAAWVPLAQEKVVKSSTERLRLVQEHICQQTEAIFEMIQQKSFNGQLGTESYLGVSSKLLYNFVRTELGVPFHCGLVEHPTVKGDDVPLRPRKTIGAWISLIFDSIIDGRIQAPLGSAYTNGAQKVMLAKLQNGKTKKVWNGNVGEPLRHELNAFH
ncbi:Imidazolonepropionase [Orbilia brochopaga]|nr:Imidazolonepropionase [Drechslerella brochopaga]